MKQLQPGVYRRCRLRFAFPTLLLILAAATSTTVSGDRADPDVDESAIPSQPVRKSRIDAGTTMLSEVLQGNDGVRIQTLCTHCNSANIQCGGLSEDLVPLKRDGFPILGGLATSRRWPQQTRTGWSPTA